MSGMATSVSETRDYEKKLILTDGSVLPDPYSIPKNQFRNNPVEFPQVCWPDIYDFLIHRTSQYTKEAIRAYKSLEAYNYFICGHVQAVLLFKHLSTYTCLRADVLPSQRQGEKATMYDAWVYVEDNGAVLSAHCTCMAGSGSACSHIAAILFKVEASLRYGVGEVASTSQLCQWNLVAKSKVTPSELCKIDFSRPRRKTPKRKKSIHTVPQCHKLTPQQWANLKSSNPRAAVFTSLVDSESDSETDTASETEQDSAMPLPLTSLYDYNSASFSSEDLRKRLVTVFDNLHHSISPEQIVALEHKTRLQRDSEEWFEQRAGRITASNFHRAVTMKEKTDRSSFVKDIIQPAEKLVRSQAIRWGISKEDTARNSYIQQHKHLHQNFSCSLSGLVVNQQYPYLGASPDAVISCTCCGKGVLEIKCPFKYKDSFPQPDDFPNDLCLDKNYSLKETHPYYYQVQGQMLILNVTYCDFFLWTPKFSTTTRVYKNNQFISHMLVKLKHQFKHFILPELVTRSTNSHLYDTVRQYCTCRRPSFGPMIACDGNNCLFQWFHYSCVGVKRAPKGKWFCANCQNKPREV